VADNDEEGRARALLLAQYDGAWREGDRPAARENRPGHLFGARKDAAHERSVALKLFRRTLHLDRTPLVHASEPPRAALARGALDPPARLRD
jgi:hypothetical protein